MKHEEKILLTLERTPQTPHTPVPDNYQGEGEKEPSRRCPDAPTPSAVRSRPRGPWDARRHRITPHRVPGGGHSSATCARCARGRRGIGLGGTVRWRCRHADVGRTHAPVRSSSCAHISQGPRGFLACDRQRRVARPRHPRCEARAPRPSRRALLVGGRRAAARQVVPWLQTAAHPAVACGATKSRRPRYVVCSPCFVGAAGVRRVATTALACTITTERPLAPKAAAKRRHDYASNTIVAHRG